MRHHEIRGKTFSSFCGSAAYTLMLPSSHLRFSCCMKRLFIPRITTCVSHVRIVANIIRETMSLHSLASFVRRMILLLLAQGCTRKTMHLRQTSAILQTQPIFSFLHCKIVELNDQQKDIIKTK